MRGHNYGFCKKCSKEHIHPKGMKGKSNKGVHKGSIPWNKGLTKETDERVAEYGRKVSKTFENRPEDIERWKETGRKSLTKYLELHPEHQKIARSKLENTKEMTLKARERASSSEIRKKAVKTFKKHYAEGKFKIGFTKENVPQYIKDILLNNIIRAQREGSSLEKKTLQVCHNNGFFPEKHFVFGRNLVTNIDLAFPEKKIAIYLDGCYWHGCPIHFPERFKKFQKDRSIDKYLEVSGWKVIRYWEHDINSKKFSEIFIKQLRNYID